MQTIPRNYLSPCSEQGTVSTLTYGRKYALLYTPVFPAGRILYLIHGGGGNPRSFFVPPFLNMIDHMIRDGVLRPLYIVSPTYYDPDETDKSPASSGVAVANFCKELRDEIIPLAENAAGRAFTRDDRIIGGFSMGGVTTWYAFLQALDLFRQFIPLSGDCWACGEKGGGSEPEKTAALLAEAVARQGSPDFFIHALTGDKDIAFPNLDPQIRAMQRLPEVFCKTLRYDVLEGGVHDYETIFRYLYNALPGLAG